METVEEVMKRLSELGSAQTVKTYRNHGATCEMFGCKVTDLKVVAKQIRGQQSLALDLYATGNSDAMYLAGIVADGSQMNRKQLQKWANDASWYMISEHTVPGIACEHRDAWDIGMKWIDAKKQNVAASGWCTLSGVLATRSTESLNLAAIEGLLDRVESEILDASNRVRSSMNGFVISVGAYVEPLLCRAKKTAECIGKVHVDVGNTACKVPLASEAISKIETMGRVGKKRKTMKC
jgi:3-methyladenine DNA glycosylase AlkD